VRTTSHALAMCAAATYWYAPVADPGGRGRLMVKPSPLPTPTSCTYLRTRVWCEVLWASNKRITTIDEHEYAGLYQAAEISSSVQPRLKVPLPSPQFKVIPRFGRVVVGLVDADEQHTVISFKDVLRGETMHAAATSRMRAASFGTTSRGCTRARKVLPSQGRCQRCCACAPPTHPPTCVPLP
jgi:hypothetical protein